MSRRVQWPSGGFLAVCLTYAATAAFFGWGLVTPSLDQVWTLHHELKIGRLPRLKAPQRRLLLEAMARHQGLTRDLLDDREIGIVSAHQEGWTESPTIAILRTPASRDARTLELNVQTPEDLLPLRITVRGASASGERFVERRTVTQQGVITVPLPPPGTLPEIIEVRLHGKQLKADPSILATRVRFPTTSRAPASAPTTTAAGHTAPTPATTAAAHTAPTPATTAAGHTAPTTAPHRAAPAAAPGAATP